MLKFWSCCANIFQIDAKVIRMVRFRKRRQLVADSRTKLVKLMNRKEFLCRFINYRTSTLQKIVKDYEGELRESREGAQQLGWRERGSIGDDKLRMLLDIEERLKRLKHNKDGQQLWEEATMPVLAWCLERFDRKIKNAVYRRDSFSMGSLVIDRRRVSRNVDYSLRITWNSNDSVWLLRCASWEVDPDHMLQRVRDAMQQIYPTDIQDEQYPHTPDGREQLLGTFKQRLGQWQECKRSLQQKLGDMDRILIFWPDCRVVRQFFLWTIMTYRVTCL